MEPNQPEAHNVRVAVMRTSEHEHTGALRPNSRLGVSRISACAMAWDRTGVRGEKIVRIGDQ
jgi:hypothetical protein